jgi:hypothetical protein
MVSAMVASNTDSLETVTITCSVRFTESRHMLTAG